jgi:hypothetical protein
MSAGDKFSPDISAPDATNTPCADATPSTSPVSLSMIRFVP